MSLALDHDSSSGLDLASASHPIAPIPTPTAAATVASTTANYSGTKRKLDIIADTDVPPTDAWKDSVKKLKTASQPAVAHATLGVTRLPPAIWQRIFLHLPPAMLCRCLRVCIDFHLYLTEMSMPQQKSTEGIKKPAGPGRMLKFLQIRCTSLSDLVSHMASVRQTCILCPSLFASLPGSIPPSLRFSKVNYIPDLDAIKEHEDAAMTLGEGAADEWRKGLITHGKEAMADSARWEKWELQLQPGVDFVHVLRQYDLSSFPLRVAQIQSRFAGVNGMKPSLAANGTHPLPQPVFAFSNGYRNPSLAFQPQPSNQQLPQDQHQERSHLRAVRTSQEAVEARQARRADIIRRCLTLEPPLKPNVLQHIESFQAAMQITTPMTESAWQMLTPRLLAQRECAEFVEHERASQLAALQAALPPRLPDEVNIRTSKETEDRMYEEAQRPLRKHLSEYADDFINGHWGAGRMLEKDNAPIFAVQVLTQIQIRYLEDRELGLLPMADHPKLNELGKQSSPPLDPFLSLDNMKWVFDTKVRPLTDRHRRELFICAACAEEQKPKWFAFDGLIQHYAAKHTTAFSKGNIVVHWQGVQWPVDPPFHAGPTRWLNMECRATSSGLPGVAQGHVKGHPPALASVLRAEQPTVAQRQGHSGPIEHLHRHETSTSIGTGYDGKMRKLASDARDVWNALEGVEELELSVRVQTSLHHALSRWKEALQDHASLDLLTDALATEPLMRPLKSSFGLACKSCIACVHNSDLDSYWERLKGAKLYNLSSLVTHFRLIHSPNDPHGRLDWKKDIIETPERQVMNELLRAAGMDDDKLALIAAAFPSEFSRPLPRIGVVTQAQVNTVTDGLSNRLLDRLSKKQRHQHRKKALKSANGFTDTEDSEEALPEPTEDEYDPRRPLFVQPDRGAADPSQFDTDARTAANSVSAIPATGLSLDATTFAALRAVLSGSSTATHVEHECRRSPSVGRQEFSPIARKSEDAHPDEPKCQPDIAAILASLTDPSCTPHNTTPPTVNCVQSGNPVRPHQLHTEQRHEPNVGHLSNGEHTNGLRNQYHIPARALPSRELQELQASFAHNDRRHESNHHNRYAEAPYMLQHTPPQYQHVVEHEQRHSQSPAQQISHMDTSSVQYTQWNLAQQQPAPGYQYERVVSKPIYIDQYGRPLELIPTTSAPAALLYAPLSYDHVKRELPMHTSGPAAGQYQTVYDAPHPIYFEQASPGSNNVPQRYAYDNGRA